jgi:hypothetical protein
MAAVVGLGLMLGILAGTDAVAQGFGSAAPDRFFRVEAQGGQNGAGRPSVRGYVYNNNGEPASRVQLLVESLDASGQVVGRSLVHVDDTVPPFGRSYFDRPVSVAGASYRVSVYYYFWLKGGGSG